KKTVLIVTHGDKYSGANPGMTPTGFNEIKALRHLIPSNPSAVICGTGKRHLDVATALRLLTPTRYSATVGGPDSLEVVNGERVVLLADGTQVAYYAYSTLQDEETAIKQVIIDLPDNAVICAGRPSMIMLGHKDAKSAAVHKVFVEDGRITGFQVITELGQTEEGTV
ncbi:MAG: hypothetical protein KAJ19_11865, partial [Gammaproteobacteria bacterium]|nr:hypothetical protein [Gammaproteobacteria bacterium]